MPDTDQDEIIVMIGRKRLSYLERIKNIMIFGILAPAIQNPHLDSVFKQLLFAWPNTMGHIIAGLCQYISIDRSDHTCANN